MNLSVVVNIGHVLQLAAPQGWLPGGSWLVTVRNACTKRPLKFLGWQKAINGGSGTALLSYYEVWRVERLSLVITWKGGKIGWYMYVTTSGIRADFSWLGCILISGDLNMSYHWLGCLWINDGSILVRMYLNQWSLKHDSSRHRHGTSPARTVSSQTPCVGIYHARFGNKANNASNHVSRS